MAKARRSSVDRIRKDIALHYAACYWSEDSLTKAGRIPQERTIEPSKFLERIVRAVRRDMLKEGMMALKRRRNDRP